MDLDKLKSDRKIDPYQLEIEVTRQPDLFGEWSDLFAELTNKAEALEHQAGMIEAKLQIRCRANPKDFGLTSISENGVKAAIKRNPAYRKIWELHLLMAAEARRAKSAMETMESKRKMLELLGKLHGQQYFAGPSIPANLMDSWKRYQQDQTQKANDRQRDSARRVVMKES